MIYATPVTTPVNNRLEFNFNIHFSVASELFKELRLLSDLIKNKNMSRSSLWTTKVQLVSLKTWNKRLKSLYSY